MPDKKHGKGALLYMVGKYLILWTSSLLLFLCAISCKSQRSVSLQSIPVQHSPSYQSGFIDKPRFLAFGRLDGAGIEAPALKELIYQVDQRPPLFILGLGNQVGGLGKTQFLNVLRYRSWWENYFFAALGAGENAAYGESELDHMAGIKFLHRNQLLSEALANNKKISHSRRGIQYHVEAAPGLKPHGQALMGNYLLRTQIGHITFWVWHIHSYSSSSGVQRPPHPQSIRWLADSMNQAALRGKKRSSRDLLIVMSHGHDEYWLKDLLTTPEGQQISRLADIFLSGSGSSPKRMIWPSTQQKATNQAIFLNIGPLDKPASLVLEAEVLSRPDRVLLAFRRADQPDTVQYPAYVKSLAPNGVIKVINNDRDLQKEITIQRAAYAH